MRFKSVIILSPVVLCFASCNTRTDQPHTPDRCVFNVAIYERDDATAEYKRVASANGPRDTVVPSEYFSPDFLPLDFSEKMSLKAIKLDGRSTDFLVAFGDEEKPLKANSNDSHVDFEEGKWRIQVTIDATSVSPFFPNDRRLSAPVQLYATEIPLVNQGKSNAEHIRGRKILKRKAIIDRRVIGKIRSLLTDSSNYALAGAMCFHPRTALCFGADESKVEILFCRECSWMYVYDSGVPTECCLKYGLNQELHDLVEELRTRYFTVNNRN